jgi:membrane-associated protein
VVAADAVLPVFPSETALITGGILSERGDLALPVLVLAGALGALVGDTILYVAGARAAGPIERRLAGRERARRRLDKLRDQLHRRTWLLIVADFLPGARTVAMFAAGVTALPLPRFYAFIVPGALLWAAVYAMLGFGGGTVFRDSFWAPLIAALTVAAVIGVLAELVDRRTKLF